MISIEQVKLTIFIKEFVGSEYNNSMNRDRRALRMIQVENFSLIWNEMKLLSNAAFL